MDIPGATNSSYTTPVTVAAMDDQSTFDVVVNHSSGSLTSTTATLNVTSAAVGAPSITTQPVNRTVVEGQTATFAVTATGTPSLTYQWRKSGVDISGARASSYTTPPTTAADDASIFDVVVSNGGGTVVSYDVSLTVNPTVGTAPAITMQPVNQTVVEGQTATFTVTATGTPSLTYQWRKSGVDINGARASSYTTPPTTAADDASIFDVVVSNGGGTVVSYDVSLTVNPTVGTAPSITTQPVNRTVVEGQTATFTVTATGTPSLTYQWRKSGVDINGARASSYTTPPTTAADDASIFDVVVSNGGGTVVSYDVSLTVNPTVGTAPSITTQPVNRTVVEGQTATFTVTATGTPSLTYQWRKSGVDINGARASSYTTPPTTAADNASIFDVMVSNGGGTVVSYDVSLTVNPAVGTAPAITMQPVNQTVVEGQTATFSVVATGNPQPTYRWKKNGGNIAGATTSSYTTAATAAGDDGSIYRVVVSNAVGRVFSNRVSLAVNVAVSVPTITTQPMNQAVAEGLTATFTVVAAGNPAPTYQWKKNGGIIAGATTSSHTTAVTAAGDDGSIYRVVVSNATGRVFSDPVSLSVNAVPVRPAIVTQATSQTVAEGQMATFTVVATGNPAPTYQWKKNGGNIVGATAASHTTPVTVAGDDGSIYRVVVSNAVGRVFSNPVLLTVSASAASSDATSSMIHLSVPVDGGDSVESPGDEDGASIVGHGRILHESVDSLIAGTAMVRLIQNGVLVNETGVPLSGGTHSAIFPVQLRVGTGHGTQSAGIDTINTAVALSNSTGADASIIFTLNRPDGTIFRQGGLTLAAYAQLTAFLDQEPFNIPKTWSGTFEFDSTTPLTVTAFRSVVNQRGEFIFTNIPVAPVEAGAISRGVSGELLVPFMASGGGWTTQLALTNPTEERQLGTVHFLGQDSETQSAFPIQVMIDGGPDSTFDYSLPPHSAVHLSVGLSSEPFRVGSARIIPDTSASPSTAAIVSYSRNSTIVSEVSVSQGPTGVLFRTYAESSGAIEAIGSVHSNIAITNSTAENNVVWLELFHLDGTPVGASTSFTLAPRGQMNRFIYELFPDISNGFVGIAQISAGAPVGVFSSRMRVNERKEFVIGALPPVNTEAVGPTSETVFPFFASGAGYSTEFIVFARSGETVSADLSLLSQDGSVVDLISTGDSTGKEQ